MAEFYTLPPDLQFGDKPVFGRTLLSIAQYIITHHYYESINADSRNCIKTTFRYINFLAGKIAEYNRDKLGKRIEGASTQQEKIDFLTTPQQGVEASYRAPAEQEAFFYLYLLPVEKILIPTKEEFEAAMFHPVKMYVVEDEPVNTQSGILDTDILKDDEVLEKVARGMEVSIPESSIDKTIASLKKFEIIDPDVTEAIERDAYHPTMEDPTVAKGIKAFQQAYMNVPEGKCSGKLNQETVFFMNEALHRGWVYNYNGYYYRFNMEERIESGIEYDEQGKFLERVSGKIYGSEEDVYICKEKKGYRFINKRKLFSCQEHREGVAKANETPRGQPLTHKEFLKEAGIVYAESSPINGFDKKELWAIASAHDYFNRRVSSGPGTSTYDAFMKATDAEREKDRRMRCAIAAQINAVLHGRDYSNGAAEWDGADQMLFEPETASYLLRKKIKVFYKVNLYGWRMSDEHYESWKAAAKTHKRGFNTKQEQYASLNEEGYKNKDSITLQSTAQYGLSIFWKDLKAIGQEIKKKKE